MLRFIIDGEINKPIDIVFSQNDPDVSDKSTFESVIKQHKPVYVVKQFLTMYIKSKLYQPYYEAEYLYSDLLRNNKIIDEETRKEYIDLENIPEQAMELETQHPYLKRFRETMKYPIPSMEEPNIPEEEQAPFFTEENVKEYPADWDTIQAVREYNRWYYENWVLQNGFQPTGYDFKVYCTLVDIERLQTAINLSTQVAIQELSEGETLDETTVPFTIYCYDGISRDITLAEAKDIMNQTWHYIDTALQQKATNRENILYANKIGDLLTVLDNIV